MDFSAQLVIYILYYIIYCIACEVSIAILLECSGRTHFDLLVIILRKGFSVHRRIDSQKN